MINYEIEKPKLSRNFDLDDIDAIRQWSSKRWANATWDEIIADIRKKTKQIYENNPDCVYNPAKNCYIRHPKTVKN
jgi:hypothetical protein